MKPSPPAALVEQVRRCVASVTRYPLEILTPEADLEDDLGIDSVKQAELLAVLAREIGAPLDRIPARARGRTIAQIAAQLADLAPAAPAPAQGSQPEPAIAADIEPQVREIVARITRYPLEILTPEADLEDDLGIDSVKQAELAVAVGRAFGLGEGLDLRSRQVRTLAGIAAAIRDLRPAAPAAAAAPAPAVVPAPAAAPVVRGPLAGKVALVTGSGRGLGKVIAQHLAAQGAAVVINSFHSREEGERTAAEIVAAGGEAMHAWGSVASPEHLDAMFGAIERRFGGLDLLVCNASDGWIGSFDQITPRDWDKAFRTNVTGGYECAMRAARLMAPRGGGSIVTMSTVTSQRYLEGFGCQGVVKAAVESLTRYLACELARYNIRANCVSAGPVYGELIHKFEESQARIPHWESITPGGALCSPADVAEVTSFLLDPRSARINGAVWVVDGGVSSQIDGRLPAAANAAGLLGFASTAAAK